MKTPAPLWSVTLTRSRGSEIEVKVKVNLDLAGRMTLTGLNLEDHFFLWGQGSQPQLQILNIMKQVTFVLQILNGKSIVKGWGIHHISMRLEL